MNQAIWRRRFSQRYRVDESTGCWIWTGKEFSQFGYGRTYVKNKTRTFAHRLAWMLYRGPIPPDLCVLHRCDVPACVNPDHLWLGTQMDNYLDMVAKGRLNRARGPAHGNWGRGWQGKGKRKAA